MTNKAFSFRKISKIQRSRISISTFCDTIRRLTANSIVNYPTKATQTFKNNYKSI